MKEILQKLANHHTLSREEAKNILIRIGQGEFNQSQKAAFLAVYIMRIISVEELLGFREAMLELSVKADLDEFDCIDLCGTGGDGKNTFNISTLSSFVVAGAGGKVSKHGNYGVSSASGSSNMLEYFGYRFSNDNEKLRNELDKAGICFLHAPVFHPAMKFIGPIRKELGMKTFFNILGPLVNPASPKYQVSGVFNLETARLFQYIFQESGKKFRVIYSLDGYDEVSLTGDAKIISQQGEQLLSPADFGFSRFSEEELSGGQTIEEAARLFYSVLEGKGSEVQNSVVAANAGLALQCLNDDTDLESNISKAMDTLLGGKALKAFKTLMEINK